MIIFKGMFLADAVYSDIGLREMNDIDLLALLARPMAEPWRNGMIESFNDRYQQMFLSKVIMLSEDDLKTGSLAFEQRHNNRYRYSKLRGDTPLKALTNSNAALRFPTKDEPQCTG